jgi:lipid-A-disaccharide synthase
MKYYLIVGEASGDLHASNLMRALKELDAEASFRFFGGDLMSEVGGTRVKHYKELAYMGFIPVLLHLRTIFKNMDLCKKDIVDWNPDVVILVDYPGFNLKIAEYIKKHTDIPIYYYISPKIWAWKEYRIKNIKRDVDELFSILPFEVDFFKGHHYPIHYVGNPCVDAVDAYQKNHAESFGEFVASNSLSDKPIIALLAGSRKQEIKDNLPMMLEAALPFVACSAALLSDSGDRRNGTAICPRACGCDHRRAYRQRGRALRHGDIFRLLRCARTALRGKVIISKSKMRS